MDLLTYLILCENIVLLTFLHRVKRDVLKKCLSLDFEIATFELCTCGLDPEHASYWLDLNFNCSEIGLTPQNIVQFRTLDKT